MRSLVWESSKNQIEANLVCDNLNTEKPSDFTLGRNANVYFVFDNKKTQQLFRFHLIDKRLKKYCVLYTKQKEENISVNTGIHLNNV